MVLNIGLIGCGTIGRRRAKVISSNDDSRIISVADINIERAKSLASEIDCEYYQEWEKIISRKDIDAVVVTTTHNYLAKISYEAALNKKHIFCEKPLGRNLQEATKAVNEASKQKVIFKTGFTLRFHPAIQKLKTIIDNDEIGKILFLRCRYGITGRSEYEKEWRANKEISGGGELLDQGIHVVDIFRWFLGDFSEIHGIISTLFWNSDVEDNAMGILKTSTNEMASFHVSWTQWNNIFSFEVYGSKGYAHVQGLGGVYGEETLTVGKKAPPDKWPPKEYILKFEEPEICWKLEWENFIDSIKNNLKPIGSGEDGLEALKLIFKIYDNTQIN